MQKASHAHASSDREHQVSLQKSSQMCVIDQSCHRDHNSNQSCSDNSVHAQGRARALIGGVYIHIFVLCPTNFF